MTSQDKRKYKRINSLNLSYVLVDGKKDADRQTMGRTLDVSEAGIRLETHLPVPVGSEMLLSIGLEDEVVDIRGRVVHSRQNEEGRHELGVQFTKVDPEVSDTLHKFIKTFKSQRGITD
jgi:c-di-GMP-binding flagellar brake protein YcgR